MSQNFKVKNGLDINGVQVIAANGQLTGPAATQITNIVSNSSDTWVRTQANAAFSKANTGTVLAQAAFDTANNSTDTWVRTAANSASSYANSSYNQANTATTNAATADQRAVTSGSYANSAYAKANTVASDLSSANTWLQSYVGTQISNLVDSAPTTLDTLNELAAALGDDANFSTTISNMVGVSGGYANSAFYTANAALSGGVTTYAHAFSAYETANGAVTAGLSTYNYANSAFATANAALQAGNAAISGNLGTYAHAEGAFTTANLAYNSTASINNYINGVNGVQNTNIAITGSYANSAFATANIAVSGGLATYAHADGAFATANIALSGGSATYVYAAGAYSHANAAFIKANTIPTGISNVAYNSFGVGTAASGTTGEIRATNNIIAYYSSDKKFKENVKDVENPLGIVCTIGSKTFDWTDEYISTHGGEDGYFVQKSDFGVIAQDVEKVFPQAVRRRADGTLAVDYEKLAILSFGAIQQLLSRIEALEAK